MATSYKNIVITPNISNTSDPRIQFSGGNSSVNTDINLYVYPDSNGALSFEGSAGQLFSITNDLSNSLFSVSDVSGIPSIEVFANGQVSLAPFGGNVGINNTTTSSAKLTVSGESGILINGAVGQFPVGLNINASGHATSRRASVAFGDAWTVGQDLSGNGTKNFFIYGGTSPSSKITIGTDGVSTFTSISETVFTITDGASVDINPANGGIQLWTLGANRTPTASSFAAGQSVTLMILDGTAFSVTWTTIAVTWVGGVAPTLDTTRYTVIELWKVGSTVYGAFVGYA